MTLANIFEQVSGKSVEDRTYNIGEISQKTGLMKTANGWVKPAGNKAVEAKGTENADIKKFDTSKLEKMKKDFEEYKKAGHIVPEGAEERYKAVKSELEKRNSEKEFKVQGMSKEEYIPWRMKAHGESEAQATSMWSHMEAQEKNKKKRDFDHSALRDSAPRALTGDCKVRIRK